MRFFSISHWLLFLSFLLTPMVHGQVISPFAAQFSANVAGNITMIGNTLETCVASASCTNAQNATGSALSNNDFQMRYIDVDSDPATFNSSRAALNLPAGASVLFAGLYWGGELGNAPTAANNKIVKFQVPGSLTYTEIGPSLQPEMICKELGRTSNHYSSFCDVTKLVQAAGNGGYTVANVQAGAGNNLYAGWSMVVAYRYAGEPARNLTVFNGYGVVSGNASVTIPIAGFKAPPAGAVRAQIGVLAFEGDAGITGDSLKLNGQFLTDSLNPSTNFFNSNFTLLGNAYTARTPNYPNLMAVDANIIDTTNFILNNATSATLIAATSGDTYFPTVFTSAIEIYAPKIEAVKTTSTSGSRVKPDDIIEYAITLKNTGQDVAAQVVLSDVIPAGTSFVAGSTEIDGLPAGALATYDALNSKVIFYLGTGAVTGTGGSLAINATTRVKFKVTVNTTVTDEQVIANTAMINFKSAVTDTALSASSNLVQDTVSRPVLVLSKEASPNPVQVGANLSYTLNYRNDGTATAVNAQIVDTLPDDVIYVSNSLGASGIVAGQTVTLPLGNLPPGASGSVNIVVQVKPGVTNATPLVNKATLSATGVTPVAATQTTIAISEPFLTLKKTASSSVVGAGRKIVYTLEFTNAGTSAATNVVLTDPIPPNTTFVAATGSPTSTNPVTWNLGTLAPGASGSVSLTVQVSSAATAATPPIENTATIDGDNTEPASSSVSTPIVTTAALQLEKLASNSNPKPGELVTYTLNFSNIGSSNAQNVALFDPLLNYQSFVSASGGGVYDSTTNRVTWDLGTLTPQQSGSVTLVVKIDNLVADGSFIKNTATLVSPGVTSVQADTRLVIFNKAKLSLKKSVSSASVAADSEFFFTLDYANTGSADSANTYIDDPLPGNTTFVSATGGGVFNGIDNIRWNLGTVPAGASGQVVLRLRTANAITNGTQIINSATINSADPTIQPVSASATTLVTSAPVLHIDKQGKEAVVAAGENQTYIINYTNTGSDKATNVVITDATPPNATFESATGSYSISGAAPNEVVTWTINTLEANTSGSVSLTVKFDTGLANGRRINNSASIQSNEVPTTSSTFITTISSAPVLKIEKVASANPAIPGQALNYTITISNVGNIAATKVVLEDPVPASYLENIQPQNGGVFDPANNTVRWEMDTLKIGETRSFNIQAQVKFPLANGTLIENSASLLSAELPPQSASVITPVLSAPNLQISKTSDVKLVQAGGQIIYSITYVNTGDAVASNTIVEEALPANTTFVSATPSQTSLTGSTYQWTIGNLAPNTPATITFTVAVDDPLPNGTVINNTASINADNAQPVGASAQVTVLSAPELVITKKTQGDVTSVAAGGSLTYVITVTNTGSDSANNMVVKDALPKGVGDQGTATPLPDSSVVNNGVTTLTWNLGTLLAGDTQTITIPVTVNSPLANGTILDNQAEVSATNAQPQSAANNVTVLSAPKLELTKTATPTPNITLTPTQASNTINYTLGYQNIGTDDALNTTLVDYLPAGVSYVSSSGGTYDPATHSVSWNLGTVAAGANAQQTMAITVPSPLLNGLALENNAEITSVDARGVPTSHATAQAVVTVASEAQLRVTKQVDQAQVAAGSHATYTLTIGNDATATDALRGWVLTDVLPLNVSFVSATGAPLYDAATRTVTWQGGSIAPGVQQTFTLTVTVNSATPNGTSVSNSATGSASNAPATVSNAAIFTVQNVPNLAIAKLAAASHVQAGQTAQYTIHYSNTGTAGATNAVIVDALPANLDLTYVSANPAPSSVVGQALTWQLGTLAPGSNGTIVLTALVKNPLANGTVITNNVTLAADSIAPIAANAGITVDSSAALSVTKQSSAVAVKTGDQVTYSITYKNQGTDAAHDVYLSDPLSADTTFISATQSGTYNAANHTVTWPLGTVEVNANSTVSVTVKVKNDLPNGIVLNNIATLSSSDAGSAQAFASNTVTRAAGNGSTMPIPFGSPWALVLLGLGLLGLGLRRLPKRKFER